MSCQSDSMKRRRGDFSHLAEGYGHLGSLDSNLPTCEASLAPSLHTRLSRPGWRRFGHWFESGEQKLLNCVLGGALPSIKWGMCSLGLFVANFKFLIPINEFQASNLYQWNQWNIPTSEAVEASEHHRSWRPGLFANVQPLLEWTIRLKKASRSHIIQLRSLLTTFGSAKTSHLLGFTTLRWSVSFFTVSVSSANCGRL